jgi:hypothetical protein
MWRNLDGQEEKRPKYILRTLLIRKHDSPYEMRATFTKFGLHVGNKIFDTQNISLLIIIIMSNCTSVFLYAIFSAAQQPNSGLGRLIVEVSITHNWAHTAGRNPLNELSAHRTDRYPHNDQHKRWTFMPSAGFELAIPAIKKVGDPSPRPQGHRDRPFYTLCVIKTYC